MKINPAQQARLASIDYHLLTFRKVSRRDHMVRFAIGSAMASNDLTTYRELLGPGQVHYDLRQKLYTPTDAFEPIYRHMPMTALGRVVMNSEIEEIRQVHSALSAMLGLPCYQASERSYCPKIDLTLE